jgi:hypothetical protein
LRLEVSVVVGMVLLIVWLTDPELPLKFESPLYVAVTISDPTGRVEYVQVAIPPLSGDCPELR